MQYIGRIDINLYKKIFPKIITDEVILTDKQREHIYLRHPETLKKYEKHFIEIIEEPDFILKDNIRENTVLLLKKIKQIDKSNKVIGNVNLVLRLAVEGDNIDNKNSIITCIPIGESRLKTYIKNGEIIYKRE